MSTVASSFIPWQADALDTPLPAGSHAETFSAGQVVSIDTDEFDEFNESVAGWSVQYHALDATCHSTVSAVMTPSLQVALVQHTRGYSSQGTNPAGTMSLAIPVDDTRPMVHRGHAILPMQVGLARSGEGYECVCRAGARFVVASVAEEKAEQYATDLWHEPEPWRRALSRLQFEGAALRSRYLDACWRILGVAAGQPGVLGDRHVVDLLEERFLEALFLNARAGPSCPIEPSRYNLARRAYRYLQARDGEVPSVRELCAATGASYATLERSFRETYGLTPKAMMFAMRLSGARRALLHPGPATTVTDVALRWGFVELGRFAAQYHKRYGEVPSETLRRVRGNSAVKRA
jgi:AraC-like DNA-binding protein